MNSINLPIQDRTALRHLRELDWIGLKIKQSLQDAIHVVTLLIIVTTKHATTSNSRTILEETNVCGVAGFIGP